jgi:hypothetical protein
MAETPAQRTVAVPAADSVPEPVVATPRLPSRRVRSCATGVGTFLANIFAPIVLETPEEVAAAPRPKFDDHGRRLRSDGVPVILSERAKTAVVKANEAKVAPPVTVRERLLKLGIDPSKGALQYLSPLRLAYFEASLDEAKKHIYRKAPVQSNTLAMELLRQCEVPKYMLVVISWGTKKNNSQSATVKLRVKDKRTAPGEKKQGGQLQLCVSSEAGGVKWVQVVGAASSTGPDNVLRVSTVNDGDVVLQPADEPTRWAWLLAVNAGLHRVSPIRCVLDQAAIILPLHPKVVVEIDNPGATQAA